MTISVFAMKLFILLKKSDTGIQFKGLSDLRTAIKARTFNSSDLSVVSADVVEGKGNARRLVRDEIPGVGEEVFMVEEYEPRRKEGSIGMRDFASPQLPQGWISKTSVARKALEVAISQRELAHDTFHFLGAVGGSLSSSATTRDNLVRTNSATPTDSGPQNVGNAVGGGEKSYPYPKTWDFDHRKNFEFAATTTNLNLRADERQTSFTENANIGFLAII
ncbi:hypothetical protein BKA70DRAFT_1234518 [Coprinopsis sp. MPI-PUGE-AT-0042]|nr:hypothetical protein BKA70DRAFT_1234518 [Coprinopsis sp. MPI-PUGE-AT-0042]